MKKGLLRGKKIASTKHSVIPQAEVLIQAAKEIKEVNKIVISIIFPVKNGPQRIKFHPIKAGIKLVVRGSISQQDIYIYTNKPDEVQKSLEKIWLLKK